MKRLLILPLVAAVTFGGISTGHAADRVVCSGSLASHEGDCKVVVYHYKDGYVPTGNFDEASFPQTKASDKSCGWQEDLVQGNAETPDQLDSPSYFRDHNWLVDSAQAPVGTPVCQTIVTTTTTTPVVILVPPTVVTREAPPATPIVSVPKVTG